MQVWAKFPSLDPDGTKEWATTIAIGKNVEKEDEIELLREERESMFQKMGAMKTKLKHMQSEKEEKPKSHENYSVARLAKENADLRAQVDQIYSKEVKRDSKIMGVYELVPRSTKENADLRGDKNE